MLESPTLESFCTWLKLQHKPKVIVLTGAGISTSAGIPDFRSLSTGIYANLAKYNLPYPEAIFDISYFKHNPEPFFALCHELMPGAYSPTPTHYFIRHLEMIGMLKRNFTQNIDGLERLALISDEYLVESHGSFHAASCVGQLINIDPEEDDEDYYGSYTDDVKHTPGCGKSFDSQHIKSAMHLNKIPLCTYCGGIVKPNIVFFGEQLPPVFHSSLIDFESCDALIIMGTSLSVAPFSSLIKRVGSNIPRLLINRDKCSDGEASFDFADGGRDAFYEGSCDDGVCEFMKLMGWRFEDVIIKAVDSLVIEPLAEKPESNVSIRDDKITYEVDSEYQEKTNIGLATQVRQEPLQIYDSISNIQKETLQNNDTLSEADSEYFESLIDNRFDVPDLKCETTEFTSMNITEYQVKNGESSQIADYYTKAMIDALKGVVLDH